MKILEGLVTSKLCYLKWKESSLRTSNQLVSVGNVSVTTILNIVEKNPSPCMGIPFASKILPDPTVTFSTFVDF